jgi:hypothetical protein
MKEKKIFLDEAYSVVMLTSRENKRRNDEHNTEVKSNKGY